MNIVFGIVKSQSLNTIKRKKGSTQNLISNSGGKNDLWRGWELYLDDQNRVNLRLINVSSANICLASEADKISEQSSVIFWLN